MKKFIKLSDLKLQKSEMMHVKGGAADAESSSIKFPVLLYGIFLLYGIKPAQE